jgi:hypothetical protein
MQRTLPPAQSSMFSIGADTIRAWRSMTLRCAGVNACLRLRGHREDAPAFRALELEHVAGETIHLISVDQDDLVAGIAQRAHDGVRAGAIRDHVGTEDGDGGTDRHDHVRVINGVPVGTDCLECLYRVSESAPELGDERRVAAR